MKKIIPPLPTALFTTAPSRRSYQRALDIALVDTSRSSLSESKARYFPPHLILLTSLSVFFCGEGGGGGGGDTRVIIRVILTIC